MAEHPDPARPDSGRPDPDRLGTVLLSVGRHLVIDESELTGLAGVPRRAPDDRPARWRRPLLVAAAVLVVTSCLVASIAPARRVVSGWLRAGHIDVGVDPDLTVAPDLPAFVDGVAPLDPAQVPDRLGVPAPGLQGSSLGSPHAWWSPPEGGVLATWDRDGTSLWIVPTAALSRGTVDKWLREPQAASPVPALADGGYLVEGRHIFQTPFRTVAAESAVAWSDGELTFRLDSTMPAYELVEVARSIVAG